jgi:hypothetical protein
MWMGVLSGRGLFGRVGQWWRRIICEECGLEDIQTK